MQATTLSRRPRKQPDVVAAWLDSPGDRAVLLGCDSTAVGLGIVIGSEGTWWTADFGYS